MEYLPYYTERENIRHAVRPGVTGLAQVNGRNLVAWDARLDLDVEYVERLTLAGDVLILLRTAGTVVSARGIETPQRANLLSHQRAVVHQDERQWE